MQCSRTSAAYGDWPDDAYQHVKKTTTADPVYGGVNPGQRAAYKWATGFARKGPPGGRSPSGASSRARRFSGGNLDGSTGLAGSALGGAIAVAVHFRNADMVGHPVEQRAGELLGSEGFSPLVKR